jgi:oligosaccharide 4-alpha-D-glucosyltransferase
MNKRLFTTLLLSVSCLISFSQEAPRIFKNYNFLENRLELETTDVRVTLTPYNNKIIEVVYQPFLGDTLPHSYAIDMAPEKVETRFNDTGDALVYATRGISVVIQKSPFKLSFRYQNKSLTEETEGFFKNDSLMGFKLQLTDDEVLYGGGERVLGMNRRGNRLTLYNKPSYGYQTEAPLMYYSMPLVISSKKYMVLWDNAARGFLDLGATNPNELSLEAIDGRSAYVIIAGENHYDLTSQYTHLTGRQPLPPRWVFGNYSSRFGYHSQEEVMNTIDAFKEDDIPVDAVVLDIYWFGKDIKGHMGNLDWYEEAFPEPVKMMGELEDKGVKTILITEPFILTTSKLWEEAVEKEVLGTDSAGNPLTYEFYFGETGLIDIFKPEAREWFWNIYKRHTDSGVDGWWGDLGEPEVHPSEMYQIYDGYRKDYPERRPFTLMRSGFAGSQRYGMIPWSGDVSRTWGGLKPQTEIALQMAMQGLGYMHSDLGGFADDYKDAELYSRWLQYGIFQPVYRPHAQEEVPAEPVFWDDTTKALAKKSIEMRYRLLPYIYNLAFENAMRGYPLMRPLFFEEPDNRELLTYKDAYLWGRDMLVAPVLEKGLEKQKLYLPKGYMWYDFYSEKGYAGGKEIEVELSDEHIPVFVRSGAFLPMLPEAVPGTDQYSTKNLQLHYYAHTGISSSEGYLYDDDGKTFNSYEKGQYELLTFKSAREDAGYSFFMFKEGGDYEGRPESRKMEFVVHGLSELPRKVIVNGEKVKVQKPGKDTNDTTKALSTEEGVMTIFFEWKGEEAEVSW